MPTIGIPELLIVLFLVMLIFGAGKVSEVGRSLGKGVREYKKVESELDRLRKPVSLDKLLGPEPKPTVPSDSESGPNQGSER